MPLPPTIDEDLRDKPTVQALMKLGQTSYLGRAATGARSSSDYVDFYAHLHRVVDEKIGRLLAALGDPDDPASLRSRTVIVRTSDHGELGLSHGGLRQKMFNAYEESIRVPLVVSNPCCSPSRARATRSSRWSTSSRRSSGWPAPLRDPDRSRRTATSARCCAGETDQLARRGARSPTTTTRRRRRSRRRRASRTGSAACATARWKYAVYLDPTGRAAPEYELYDLEADPDEAVNLADKRTGRGRTAEAERERVRLHALLEQLCIATNTVTPALPPARR